MYWETRWQTLEHLSSHFPRPNLIPDSSPASLLVLQVAFGPVSEATGGTKHGLLAHSWQLLSTASPLFCALTLHLHGPWSSGTVPALAWVPLHTTASSGAPALGVGALRAAEPALQGCAPRSIASSSSDLGVPSAGFHFYSLLFKLTDVYRQIPVKLQISILLGSFLSPLILFLWPGKITMLKSSEK